MNELVKQAIVSAAKRSVKREMNGDLIISIPEKVQEPLRRFLSIMSFDEIYDIMVATASSKLIDADDIRELDDFFDGLYVELQKVK